MGIPESQEFITVDEYIEGELLSEVRHEYIGGQVYAMSGASEAHNVLSGNLHAALHQHLRGKPCKVFIADMKVRLNIPQDDIFYYPDLLVTCDPADDAKYYKSRPVVLVEVLSPSTERLDRREKFLSYQRLPSLREYVLVDQEKKAVTVFRKETDWAPEHQRAGDSLRLDSVEFGISMADLYEDVLSA
jgi:Uma2 family endonuclease